MYLDKKTNRLNESVEEYVKTIEDLSHEFYYAEGWPTQFVISLIEQNEEIASDIEEDILGFKLSKYDNMVLTLYDLLEITKEETLDYKYMAIMFNALDKLFKAYHKYDKERIKCEIVEI